LEDLYVVVLRIRFRKVCYRAGAYFNFRSSGVFQSEINLAASLLVQAAAISAIPAKAKSFFIVIIGV
jgi:hypothetical protein